MNRKRIALLTILLLLVVALICVLFVWRKNHDTTSTSQQQAPSTSSEVDEQSTDQRQQVTTAPPVTQEKPTSQPTPPLPSSSQPPVSKWPVQISAAEASSVTVVVNKKHQLPSSYVPSPLATISGYQMRSDAKVAADSLLAAASNAGYPLKVISAYRSYEYQKNLYNNYVKRDGQAAADTYSARPGFSEHQLGLVADVGNGSCDLEICFGDSPAGKWLATNSQNYGFIVRYPKGKEAETGYQYEPWHLRYIGVDVAKSVYASGKTLDQYYNVPAGGYE